MKSLLEEKQFDHLLEIAHLALDERMSDEARHIFDTLTRLRPAHPHPRIGLALILYSERQVNDAIDALESILRDFPNAIFTRSLLARFAREVGRDGWQQYARDALALSPTGIAADMARALLVAAGEDDALPVGATNTLSNRPADFQLRHFARS